MKTKTTFSLAIFIASLFLLSGNYINAKNVSLKTAKNVALNIYAERSGSGLKNVKIDKVTEIKENGVTCLYVLEYSVKGFAVISADDIVQPVLGYSFESYYDENDLAPGFEFFVLKRNRKQIYAAIQAKMSPDAETVAGWAKYSSAPASFQPKAVESAFPLLTTVWNQNWPYNALCPVDTNSGGSYNDHVPLGCVATAMAQVLNYWHHPWHGTGYHSYTPEDHPEYGTQSADFANTYYNFDNMPDNATAYSEDLAELNYHCGVAVDMEYGPDGSGAWGWGNSDVKDALQNYFYFSDDGNDINRSSYPVTWVDKMKENLDLNRPVIYGGTDTDEDAGHAWVLDAYTTGDMFHCNWGWGGSDDGFFSIDNFGPVNGGYTFDFYEHASVNIHPKTGTLSGTLTLAGSPYIYNYDQYVNAGSQLTIEPGVEIIFNGRYKLEVRGRLTAQGTNSDSIKFLVQLSDIGMRGVRFINLNENSADSSKLEYCLFSNGKGEYTVVNMLGGIKGGGIYCENSSKVLIANNTIKSCKAEYGGGIACYDTSNVMIKNCEILFDTATMGGGIFLSNSDAVLSNNTIRNNYVEYSTGGGVFCSHSDAVFFKDIIRYNKSHFGAGIGFNDSQAVLDSVTIKFNEADIDGGGLYLDNSDIILNDVQIYGNEAGNQGGAMVCYNNSDPQFSRALIHNNLSPEGASMVVVDANPFFTNSTITDNIANAGASSIYIIQGGISINSSILWNNQPEEIDTSGICSVNTSYSIIQNGNWSGTGVINKDPLFESPLTSNYHLKWNGFPLPDLEKSSAIDSGDPVLPNDPDGTRADMGSIPYEQTYTSIPGGTINGTLTCAGSPYYVYGDLTVPVGDELIIEPCVTMVFQGDYEFEVRGRLLAEGTEADRITFISADTTEGWQGIRFINTETNGQDSSKLVHCRISFGNANGWSADDKRGGALFFSSSGNVFVGNCLLNKNKAEQNGGAIYCAGTNGPHLSGNTFENNTASYGGALFWNYPSGLFENNTFQNNTADYGGAIFCKASNIEFNGNTIKNNRAELFGGGIYFDAGGTQDFSPSNKNNIFLNYAGAAGLDFYFDGNASVMKNITVDTFTVLNPNKHFAYPADNFNIVMDSYIIEQTGSNLYVSMTGSDDNTGTDPTQALKTIYMAMMKIMADESDTAVVYLADGTYSEGATGEVMPVNLRSYVSLVGTGLSNVTLYGEEKNRPVYCYDDQNFLIRDLNIQGGEAENGGGIILDHYSAPRIVKVKIHQNHATGDGGGIYCYDYSSPVLDSVIVMNNSSDGNGGGIVLYGNSNAVLNKVDIVSNTTFYSGGGLRARLYCDFQMNDCNISNNSAANGAGVMVYFYSNAEINNSEIFNNNAVSYPGYPAMGGGVYISYGSEAGFYNSNVTGNSSDYQCGGIYCHSNRLIFENGKINSNSATNSAGGLYFYGVASQNIKIINSEICSNDVTDYYGGAVYLNGSSPEFINTTISGNNANSEAGQGIYCNFSSEPVFRNSIIWNNSPMEIEVVSGSLTATYCDIKDGWAGTGNIDSDPQFVNVVAGNFSLLETSPCIDAGNPDTTGLNLPAFDLAGNPRITNDIIDMGAYEYLPAGNLTEVDIRIFLEGPFNGTDMTSSLNSDLPLMQPYNTSPWNYDGDESVAVIPNSNVVDWVLVELRDALSAENATPDTRVAIQAGFLLSEGKIVGLDGSSPLLFDDLTVENLMYVIVWHRNHLGIISAIGMPLSGFMYYNFTFSGDGVLNPSSNGYKEIAPDIWGMVAGDANADGEIDAADKTLWRNDAGKNGYKSTDMNMDNQVDNRDKNDYWVKNENYSSQVPE